MTLEQFTASLREPAPPEAPALLAALWWEAKGSWDRAHEIAQSVGDSGLGNVAEAAWVHAYLHRKEGDDGNAAYWYRRAARPASQASLPEEWREIALALLDR